MMHTYTINGGLVVHLLGLINQKAEVTSLTPAWSTQQIPDQPECR